MGQNQTTKEKIQTSLQYQGEIQTSLLISTKEKIQTSLQYQGENSIFTTYKYQGENSNCTPVPRRKFKLHSL